MSKAERDRERRVADLVKRGHATGDEILVAQFGEIPKGLDQDTPLTDLITFHSTRKDPKFRLHHLFAEYGHINESETERKIYLNHFLMGSAGKILGLLATRMALARVHDLGEVVREVLSGRGGPYGMALSTAILAATVLSSFRYAMFSSFVKAFNPSLANIVGEETMHTLAAKNGEPSWTVLNAFRANALDEMKNSPNFVTKVKQAGDMLLTMMPISYFQEDREILGRLFNLAARGYAAHGQLPTNTAEGQAFLLDMGIVAPNEVHLYFASEHQKAVREVFYRHNSDTMGMFFPPSAEINIGINSYRDYGVLCMYWKDAFPAMLGEMYRLLGNSNGPERFGFDSEKRDLKGVPMPQTTPLSPLFR